jgi:hypothetical protein
MNRTSFAAETSGALALAYAIALGAFTSSNPAGAAEALKPRCIVVASDAGANEQLAAREIRRYAYLRTGELLPIAPKLDGRSAIVVGRGKSAGLQAWVTEASLRSRLNALKPQQYWLKTVTVSKKPALLVAGGDDVAVLYAAYRLAEHWGVRFYLHGDVLPDAQTRLGLPVLDENVAPLFALRGIQPFHDFPEGPDWWNRDDYLAILSQLPKLRMNFFGLHTYPEGGPNAEPTVWIGQKSDVGSDGRVKFSYPASYQNTLRGNWCYTAKKTGDYALGAAQLFDRDDFGAEVMRGQIPQPTTPDGCNLVFERTADLLRTAFVHARQLGVKTCVGTETALTVPQVLRERLKAQGKDPADPAVLKELYAGIYRRIQKAYPIDYYWFWTPEGWTWEGTKDEQIKRTIDDLLAGVGAATNADVPFKLATCGWVLGPQQDRAMFDKVLPKNVAVSCINREVGKTPVDKGFADVSGRGKWAIPWLEDDPALTSPQLWVGRMRRDAADARRYGCDGLMGIHWRTRVLGPAVSALAQAAWTQDAWNPAPGAPLTTSRVEGPEGGSFAGFPSNPIAGTNLGRVYPPTTDFYGDWARQHFGPEVGAPAAALFEKIDGKLPRPSDWVDGPGGIRPDPRPWDQAAKDYAFVDEFAALQSRVKGAGNRERFDWWLHTFQYLRAMGQVNCLWARYTNTIGQVQVASDEARQKQLARDNALPARRQLVAAVTELYQNLLATVSNPGELGTVMNWEAHNFPGLLTRPGEELAKLLGEPLPADAQLATGYRGPLRVIVPTVRTSVNPGEALELKVLVLSEAPPKEGAVHWRVLGQGGFNRVPLTSVARGVYSARLGAAHASQEALEYYVEVQSRDGHAVHFPATAPKLNQTVVVAP